MRAAGPTAGGYSFELLLAGANDAVEEYTETARETLIEHDLQPDRREDKVSNKKILSSALELMRKTLEEKEATARALEEKEAAAWQSGGMGGRRLLASLLGPQKKLPWRCLLPSWRWYLHTESRGRRK
jgi:hypothetical protein